LAGQGVRLKSTGRGFREWLEQVRLWDGSPLPQRLGQQVLVEYDRLCFVRGQIAAVERERSRLLKESQERDAAVARKLLIALWRWVGQDTVPEGAVLKA